jgi:hypothetical protein
MKTLSRYLIPFVLGSAVILTAAAARDTGHDRHDGPSENHEESEGATARVKFSDPSKPGTLKLALPWAEARVTAYDGNEVIVTSTLDEKNHHREVDSDGFRRLDEDQTFELVEKNNVATIVVAAGESSWIPQGAEFDIKVPRNTNLVLRTEAGGDISVDGVEGDIDVNSMNGEITLTDISNSAVVNTMNGEIHATFKKAPVKPVSLSSMNGEIDLRLPGDTKANLRMRTHNGSIRTNFAEGALQTKTEKVASRYPADSRDAQRERDREMAREKARADRERARTDAGKAGRTVAPEKAEAPESPETPEAPEAPEAPEVNTRVSVVVNGTTVVAPMPMSVVIPPMPNFGGKSIVGTLNGGGVDIKLTSMNGTITLRETK